MSTNCSKRCTIIWLNFNIQNWLAIEMKSYSCLLKLLQLKPAPVSVVANSALCRPRPLSSSRWYSLLLSYTWTLVLSAYMFPGISVSSRAFQSRPSCMRVTWRASVITKGIENKWPERKNGWCCAMYILIAMWLVTWAGGIFPSEIIKNVSRLPGNLLNDLRYYVNKNLLVKPVSSNIIGLPLFLLLSAR